MSGEAAPLLEKRRSPGRLLAAFAAVASAGCGLAAWTRSEAGAGGAALAAAAGASIDRVFYINCDGDDDRRASIEAELDAHLPAAPRERVACVSSAGWTSATLPGGVDDAALRTAYGDDLAYAYVSYAIYLSHRKALRAVAARPPNGRYLILEDDAAFVSDFGDKFAAMAPSWPATYDLVRLGCWQREVAVDRQPGGTLFAAMRPSDRDHQVGTIYMGNHAALYTVRGANRMLALYDATIDHTDALSRTMNLDKLASYCVACAHTLVSTDEALPQDHNADDDAVDTGHVDARTCVPADD